MARCVHGFERSVVPCPDCGPLAHAARPAPHRADRQPQPFRGGPGRQRLFSDAELIAALSSSRSIKQAAARVPCNAAVFYQRARTQPALRELLKTHKAPTSWGSKFGHPGFQDLTGMTLAGAKITGRAANQANGNAAWHCKLACGCTAIRQGIYLRAQDRAGGVVLCQEHRGRRPGIVLRRARPHAKPIAGCR